MDSEIKKQHTKKKSFKGDSNGTVFEYKASSCQSIAGGGAADWVISILRVHCGQKVWGASQQEEQFRAKHDVNHDGKQGAASPDYICTRQPSIGELLLLVPPGPQYMHEMDRPLIKGHTTVARYWR